MKQAIQSGNRGKEGRQKGCGECPFSRMEPRISLLTDFGNDGAKAFLHSAVEKVNPRARVRDLTHAVPHFNVLAGATRLAGYTTDWTAPAHGIYLGVVDPGVGGGRLNIIVRGKKGNVFIGPDNGILSLAFDAEGVEKAFAIDEGKLRAALKAALGGGFSEGNYKKSETFHGRDVFAPAAALISLGFCGEELGTLVEAERLARISLPSQRPTHGSLVDIDSFGSLRTTIPNESLLERVGKKAGIVIADREKGRVLHEGEAVIGTTFSGHGDELLAVLASTGKLDLAFNSRNASERLGIGYERVALDTRYVPITEVALAF